MILTGNKMVGKRLLKAMLNEIEAQGYTEVATVSVIGVERIKNAGQKLSDVLNKKINGVPSEKEIEIHIGDVRMALVIRFEVEK